MKKSILSRGVGLAGLAKDMRAVKRAPDETVKGNARRHLAQRMGKLKGLPQKIGQIMSMSDDEDKADAFSDLSENAEPLPFDEIKEVLEREWGGSIETVVSEIDPHGRAASLGQVHRATLHSGEEVAVKVAYPGIQQAVKSDLKLLGWLSAPVGDLRRGFDLSDYRREIVRDLDEELDYRKELKNQQEYGRLVAGVGSIVVPCVFDQWSTSEILVTGWEDGETIDQAAEWEPAAKAKLAALLVRHFLVMAFDHGVVHGDPHAGNYRFRNSPTGPSIVLYDYGSVARLSTTQRLTLLQLIAAAQKKKGDPLALFTTLGFNADLLTPIRAKLPALCSVLLEPFCAQGKYDLTHWHRSERIDDILGDDRWNFRMSGPASLILLMRAFHGVLYYLNKLAEPAAWSILLRPIMEKNEAFLTQPPARTGHDEGRMETIADYLKVEVFKDGRSKVALTFPAAAVEDLDDLIDDDIKEAIAEQNVDLPELVRQARRNGYAPMELFTWNNRAENKELRVWLQ